MFDDESDSGNDLTLLNLDLTAYQAYIIDESQIKPKPYESQKVKENQLGVGGFGLVYHAIWSDGHQNLHVAVKTLRPEILFPKIARESLLRELKLASNYAHHNLIHIYGIIITNQPKSIGIVMQLADRGTFYDVLHNVSKYPDEVLNWNLRVGILLHISRGMLHLHTAKETPILHRDLKACNILIDQDWAALISDFGVSRAINDLDQKKKTSHVGSVLWQAPEIKTGQYSSSSDVYSFGVVMFETMTRELPYYNTKEEELKKCNYRMDTPPSVPSSKDCKAATGCPQAYVELMMDCWATPSQRPNFRQISDRLKDIMKELAPFSSETSPRAMKETKQSQLMISYFWESRELATRLRAHFLSLNVPVSLSGDGEAVYQALVVIPILTEKYQRAANCQQELQIAADRKVPVVPIKEQAKWNPSDWLKFFIPYGESCFTFTDESKFRSFADDLTNYLKKEFPVLFKKKKMERKGKLETLRRGDVKRGEMLDFGNHGTVYAAVWKGMEVAIKSYPETINDADVRLVSEFVHPNLVQIFGIIDDAVVMELGTRNLSACRPNSLYWSTRLCLLRDIANVIVYLETFNRHPSVTVRNILIRNDWTPFLDYLGIEAIRLDRTNPCPEVFESPEVLADEPRTSASTSWQFGLVMFYLGSGKFLFTRNLLEEMASYKGSPPEIEGAPEGYNELIRDCLQKNPENRPSALHILKYFERKQEVLLQRKDFGAKGRVLGVGVSGEVYETKWRGIPVAVKRFHDSKLELSKAVSRLVNLPLSIGRVYGYYIELEHAHLVTELGVDNLHQFIQKSEYANLSWCRKLTVLLKLARILHTLLTLRERILITDLKPANVILRVDESVFLTDFGIEADDFTPAWTAPEASDGKYSEKSVIYSFAMIMYEILTRQVPFWQKSTQNAILFAVSQGSRPLIPQSESKLPVDYLSLMEKCWSQRPEDRPSSDEVCLRLETMVQEEEAKIARKKLEEKKLEEKKTLKRKNLRLLVSTRNPPSS